MSQEEHDTIPYRPSETPTDASELTEFYEIDLPEGVSLAAPRVPDFGDYMKGAA